MKKIRTVCISAICAVIVILFVFMVWCYNSPPLVFTPFGPRHAVQLEPHQTTALGGDFHGNETISRYCYIFDLHGITKVTVNYDSDILFPDKTFVPFLYRLDTEKDSGSGYMLTMARDDGTRYQISCLWSP